MRFSIPALLVALALLLVREAPVYSQNFLFEEEFTGIAEGERPPVGRWQTIGPTAGRYWVASGGVLQSGNLVNQAPSYALVNMVGSRNWTDVRAGADASMRESRGSILLSVRAQDGRNQYTAYFDVSITSGGNVERTVRIVRLTNGIPQPLARITPGDARRLPNFEDPGRFFRFEFEARGSSLIAYIEGEEVLRATDTTFSSGTAGLGAANTVANFDYFAVTPAGVAAPKRHFAPEPTANSGGAVWRVLIRADLSQADAESIARDLSNGGVEVVALPRRGRHAVYMGSFATESEAQSQMEVYSREGFLPRAVERTGDAAVATPPPPRRTPAAAGYRTLVGLFNTRSQAEARQAEVQAAGLFPVDVVSDGNSHKVFVGHTYNNREEAEAYAQQLHADGLSQVGVYQVGDIGALDLSYLAQASENIEAELTRDEREQLINVFAEMERARRDGGTAAQHQVQANIGTLGSEQRRFLTGLEEMRGGSEVIGDVPRPPALATPRPQVEQPGRTTQEVVQALRTEAITAEDRGDFERAIELWNQVKASDPSGQMLNQANEAISRVQRRIDERGAAARPTTATATGGGGINFGLIGGVLGGIIVVAVIALFVLKRKPSPAPAKAKVRTPASTMAIPSLGGGTLGGTRKKKSLVSTTPISKPAQKASQETAPQASQQDAIPLEAPTPVPSNQPDLPAHEVVGASARIRPGVVSPAPKVEEKPAEAATTDSNAAISLSGFGGGKSDSTTQVPVPPKPDSAPAVHTGKVKVDPPRDANLFYEQAFDNEEVGAVPSNWKGATAHDHASLSVVDRDGGGRCMKFEKNSGTGSAYFSCRFPDASGRFSVEFDICCMDKNKYLLGFYVEKDEDFRQSVSTVIHRDTSRSDKVTLRVQNEVADYELGQWRKVRFVIDLQRHIVDAYLDDESLALGIRLTSRPDVLNTLSIRDNLATEGILMIDNIRIRKA